MNRKMLVLDIDGTLTNSHKEVTAQTLQKIIDCQKAGHVVVVASGRPTPGIADIADTLCLADYDGYVLSFNGAMITHYGTGEVIYRKNLDHKLIADLYRYSLLNDLGMMTYDDTSIITGTRIDSYMELESRENKIPIRQVENFVEYVNFPVCKCLLTKDENEASSHENKLQAMHQAHASVYRSEPFFIEVMAKGIDKAASLDKLRSMLHIEQKDIIACGDGFNDVSMVRYAGVGVAMENAQQVVKDVADYITRSNDEDGIANVIDKFILSD